MEKKSQTYPVLCAWCEAEGVRTVLGYASVEGSHGICPRHAEGLREQARRYAKAIEGDVKRQAAERNELL